MKDTKKIEIDWCGSCDQPHAVHVRRPARKVRRWIEDWGDPFRDRLGMRQFSLRMGNEVSQVVPALLAVSGVSSRE